MKNKEQNENEVQKEKPQSRMYGTKAILFVVILMSDISNYLVGI